MIESVLGLVIASASFGFSVLMYFNNNGRRANERITMLETRMQTMIDIPQRVTKVEITADYAHTRLTSLETELKDMMEEIKSMQIEILRNTKV